MAIAEKCQTAHRQTLWIGLSGRRKRFNIAVDAFAGFLQFFFVEVTHHTERMDNPIDHFFQERLPLPINSER